MPKATTNLSLVKDPGVGKGVWKTLDTIDAKLNAGLQLTGATAASRYVGATASGAPISGTFAIGDFSISRADGVIYVCTTAGSPGTWVANSSTTVAGNPAGVAGATQATRYVGAIASGTAPATGTSWAVGDFVIARDSGRIFVCTVASNSDQGTWVDAASTAVTAAKGLPVGAAGATGASRYVGGTTSGSPSTGTSWAVGDVVVSRADGLIYVCTVASSGDQGTWVVAGTTAFLPLAGGTVTGEVKFSGNLKIAKISEPQDSDLAANEAILYFTPTNGAAALSIKAKQANGSVKTGTVAVTT